MRFGAFLVVLGGGAFVLGVACGGDDEDDKGSSGGGATGSGAAGSTGAAGGTGCAADPFACPAGQTCWPNAQGNALACLNSGMGKVGDACELYIGTATCADDLVCWTVPGAPKVCTPFCDNTKLDKQCPPGQMCLQVSIKDTSIVFFACQPLGMSTVGPGGAGGTGAAGGGGTGGTGGG
jgi:hypothetical protein